MRTGLPSWRRRVRQGQTQEPRAARATAPRWRRISGDLFFSAKIKLEKFPAIQPIGSQDASYGEVAGILQVVEGQRRGQSQRWHGAGHCLQEAGAQTDWTSWSVSSAASLLWTRNGERPAPYVGLDSFGEEDAGLFFGRDAERKRIIGNLRASRLTVLYARERGREELAAARRRLGPAPAFCRAQRREGARRAISPSSSVPGGATPRPT